MILLFWRCGTKYVINEITLENPLVKCSHSLIFSSCISLIKKTIDKTIDCLWDYGFNLFYNSIGLC